MSTYPKEVTQAEVSAVLRQAIAGEIQARDLAHLNWWEVNEPDVELGDWLLTLFIEGDWICGVYAAYAPDGRVSEFAPRDGDSDIEQFLSHEETEQLCDLLGRGQRPPRDPGELDDEDLPLP